MGPGAARTDRRDGVAASARGGPIRSPAISARAASARGKPAASSILQAQRNGSHTARWRPGLRRWRSGRSASVASPVSDLVVDYLLKAPAGRTSREISEGTRVPLRKVQKRLRELCDQQLLTKSGRRYAFAATVPAGDERAPPPQLEATSAGPTSGPHDTPSAPPSSVRRPRALAQLAHWLPADVEIERNRS
jgi:hypothetical protein